MNVFLHKLKIHLLLPFCFLAAGVSFGQAPTLEVYDLVMLKNDTLEFEVKTYNSFQRIEKERPAFNEPGFNLSKFKRNGSPHPRFGNKGAPGVDTIVYIPPTGFIGRDTIEILRWIEGPGYSSKDAYIILHITVVPSFLTAMPDYVATYQGQSIEIDVLANDYGNGTNQTIAEVTNKNRGDAVLTQNDTKVLFTPTPGFIGLSHFNYSICDAQGACDMTTVSICVMNPNPPAYDSISVQTKEGETQVILMALDSGYTVTQAPQHGVIDTADVLLYVPNNGFSGVDKVVFEDAANNRERVFEIEVIGPAPYQSVYLKDDIIHTAVDEDVEEIHLLANDDGGAYMTNVSKIGGIPTAMGGEAIYLPNIGKGVYRYNPPAGFSGVDYFRYKARVPDGNFTDTATCYIVVDDLVPAQSTFELFVPENTPLVLGDHLPFETYDYQIISSPDPSKATLAYYPGYDTYTSQYGQEVSGYNMLIYEPLNGTSGNDEFEVEYCISGTNNCQLVKVEMEVISGINSQNDTLCAGTGCVWPGDTDKNGKVDINDLLPIGLCMGEVGQSRVVSNDSIFYARHADDWNSLFVDGLGYDVKHVDSDGNGIISSMDTIAIKEFYGAHNNLVPVAPAPISSLPFYPGPFPPGNLQPGDVILIPLHLGNTNLPAFDAYGLTFSVDYDPVLFESVKVFWNDDAWMNYNSPVLTMDHKPYPGKLEAGYTRTSGLAATGHGVIGVLEFIVVDDLVPVRVNSLLSNITISGNLMNSSGQNNSLDEHTLTFSLGLNEDGEEEEANDLNINNLKVFPNPSTATVNVHLNGGQDNLMERISLYNMVGSQVYDSGSILAKRTYLDVSDLNPGVYVMRVWANGEVLTSKVEVLR